MRHYVALIHKDPDSDFGVSFPDFPGCITAGRSMDEAWANAHEALAFHIEGLIQDGETVPSPSPLDSVMSVSENRDGIAVLVSLPDEVLQAA